MNRRFLNLTVLVVLALCFTQSDRLTRFTEVQVLADEIVFARTTPYQRIVMTRSGSDFQVFLNGNLQFSSVDEYRYHEALVHPMLAAAKRPRRVLVLGGGDGLAVRELLKHKNFQVRFVADSEPDVRSPEFATWMVDQLAELTEVHKWLLNRTQS